MCCRLRQVRPGCFAICVVYGCRRLLVPRSELTPASRFPDILTTETPLFLLPQCELNVDCTGAWSTCAVDCAAKMFSVATFQSGRGSPCGDVNRATQPCAAGEDACPPDIDCAGSWSLCDAECGDRNYTITMAQSGRGSRCASPMVPFYHALLARMRVRLTLTALVPGRCTHQTVLTKSSQSQPDGQARELSVTSTPVLRGHAPQVKTPVRRMYIVLARDLRVQTLARVTPIALGLRRQPRLVAEARRVLLHLRVRLAMVDAFVCQPPNQSNREFVKSELTPISCCESTH